MHKKSYLKKRCKKKSLLKFWDLEISSDLSVDMQVTDLRKQDLRKIKDPTTTIFLKVFALVNKNSVKFRNNFIQETWSCSLILSLAFLKHLGNWFIFIHASSWNLRLLKAPLSKLCTWFNHQCLFWNLLSFLARAC